MKLQTGGKGKSFNDRVLAAEVRTMTLEEIKKALQGNDIEFKKAVILKLAGTVLPRLNEHTGADGEPIFDAEAHQKATKAVGQFLNPGHPQSGEQSGS